LTPPFFNLVISRAPRALTALPKAPGNPCRQRQGNSGTYRFVSLSVRQYGAFVRLPSRPSQLRWSLGPFCLLLWGI
jgi:hypothetical protein